MDLPICTICAKTGVLCSACEAKLQNKEISGLDVELSRVLYETGVEGIGFRRVIDTKDFIVVLTKKEDIGKIIGRGGDNIRLISKKLGKKVRVIGAESVQDAIHDFITPAQVTAVNTVYALDGSVIKRIKIDGRDKKKLRMNVKEIERLLSLLTTEKIQISFE